ncbi:GAF and ANTAR domain-containing protein [Streptomyces aureus]|uniref:GAF and ANTAR domain-containing protein n=1 Tax=Streptomyces aureus TaxID=193461 RepID=UPI0036B64BC4
MTESATELVEGCDAAGILIVRGSSVATFAPTSRVVIDSDQLQERFQEGPCFDAARESERVFRIANFTTQQQRWPAYVPPARELGLGSMMGFLLYTDDQELGALNLYSYCPEAFTEDSETVGWLLASHAAVALSSARDHDQMEQAMATRHTIGEAMGILMGRHHITEHEAFDVLRRYPQEKNIKLREVARQVCETGNVP